MINDTHDDTIRRAFRKQAGGFADPQLTLANRAYMEWMLDHLDIQPQFVALDVATGTGHLARALAERLHRVTALDLTPEMLAAGSVEAQKTGLHNIDFQVGSAEQLPYADASFDIVASRFAVHHFPDPVVPLREMVRVVRSGGQVCIVDLVAPDNKMLAARYNYFERVRDPSHVQALTAEELNSLFTQVRLSLVKYGKRDIEVDVDRWLSLTGAPEAVRQEVYQVIRVEFAGGEPTGLRPLERDGHLFFVQTWLVLIGRKVDHSQ